MKAPVEAGFIAKSLLPAQERAKKLLLQVYLVERARDAKGSLEGATLLKLFLDSRRVKNNQIQNATMRYSSIYSYRA